MAKPDTTKNVVILGGGGTGTLLARQLSKKLDRSKFNLILVNDREYFVHLVAMARAVVTAEDDLEHKAIFGYDKLFYNGNGTVKIGKVISVVGAPSGEVGGEVTLESGEKISYHSLIVATGCKWPELIELPRGNTLRSASQQTAIEHISNWRARFEKANHVVIVGGGAVGIELAGEIRYHLPTKRVTLVHRDAQLLNDVYPEKFRKDIERRVRTRKIDLILGDSLDVRTGPVQSEGVTTKKGTHIPDADLVVEAFGSTPNTQFLESLGPGVLNQYGSVKVNEFLQVQGHKGVFAIGDIIDWPEQKQIAKGAAHAGVVAANVLSFVYGNSPSKKYGGSPEMILIPLGKSGGSGYLGFLWGILIGDFLSKLLKGKGLMVGMARSQRGE